MSGSAPPQAVPQLADERLDFETLIADVSARLLATSPDAVERTVTDALKEVRVFFRGDRCGLLPVGAGGHAVHVLHASYGEGVTHVSGQIELRERFPWSRRQLIDDGVPVRLDAHLARDTSRPDVLRYLEEWRSLPEFGVHLRSNQFARLVALVETSVAPPLLECRLVSESRGIAYIASVRGLDRPAANGTARETTRANGKTGELLGRNEE